MAIDIFSRLASGLLDEAEKIVLRRVVSILEARGEDAAILVNMLLDRHEVDLVVATETVTLVIEVKGYSRAVEGLVNDRTWRVIGTGEELDKNPYAQVNSASLELKDALRKASGTDPGYAHAVLLFAHGIPSGSMLPRSDHRVTIAGVEALDELLSTPIPAGSKRRLWSSDLVRWFARKNGLTLIAGQAVALVPIEEVQYVEVSTGIDHSGALPGTLPRVIDLRGGPASGPALGQHSRRRTGLRWVMLCFGLPILLSGVLVWLHHTNNVLSKATSGLGGAHGTSRRHAASVAIHRPRTRRGKEKGGASAAFSDPQQFNSQTQATQSMQSVPTLPPPPCPPGIDRLGCVPDAQTLARLRNDR